MENILKPLPVGNLLQQENDQPTYNFFIPSYQRGYRWDTNQVTELLDDLYEFISNSESSKDRYCLQPIVVKQLPDGRYEVLDGQQRLTTIFILLTRLKKGNNDIELFSLGYETRLDSAIFLKEFSGEINDTNPDYYYISQAYVVIDEWLAKTKKAKANIATKLFDALAESIEFIWYEITEDVDAIDVFTRINIGKIPLTNAELVKAVFLSKSNLSLGYASLERGEKDFNRILSLKQNAIALEWDQVEKTLQDPKVWGFVYGGEQVFQTRIDYLLDLVSGKNISDKNKYHSFKYFYDKVRAVRQDKARLTELSAKNTSVIEEEWNELKSVYDILVEWYSDKVYNHLIGFLIRQDVKIRELIEDFQNLNRSAFLKSIKSKISNIVKCDDISELEYGRHNKKIEQILLLHNVVCSLHAKEGNAHFPFEKLGGKLWTLEHIFAQHSDDLREEHFLDWINDHLSYFESCADDTEIQIILSRLTGLKLSNKKIEREKFEDAFKLVSEYIQREMDIIEKGVKTAEEEAESESSVEEYAWVTASNSIGNLALLDGSVNSALKNSLFDIKRKRILEKDKEGSFVPSETKKVFLKYYTPSPKHLAYWTFEDRKAYVESIKKSLNYLN